MGRGTFGGKFGARHCNQWGLYGVRVRQCRDAALFPNYFGQTCINSFGVSSRCCSAQIRTMRLNLLKFCIKYRSSFFQTRCKRKLFTSWETELITNATFPKPQNSMDDIFYLDYCTKTPTNFSLAYYLRQLTFNCCIGLLAFINYFLLKYKWWWWWKVLFSSLFLCKYDNFRIVVSHINSSLHTDVVTFQIHWSKIESCKFINVHTAHGSSNRR